MSAKMLPLDQIRTDGGSQLREGIDEATIRSYTDLVIDGATFPPVEVFHDGAEYWLADGFHRYHAHRQAGKESIRCDVSPGTRREAVLFAAGANSRNGLRRTNEDKRKAVRTLLADPEWSAWSDHAIAKACSVSHTFVSAQRKVATLPVEKLKPATVEPDLDPPPSPPTTTVPTPREEVPTYTRTWNEAEADDGPQADPGLGIDDRYDQPADDASEPPSQIAWCLERFGWLWDKYRAAFTDAERFKFEAAFEQWKETQE